jgi:hypothetical protein
VVSLSRERSGVFFFLVAPFAACHYTERKRNESFFLLVAPLAACHYTERDRKKSFFLFASTDFSGSLCEKVFFLKKNREMEHRHLTIVFSSKVPPCSKIQFVTYTFGFLVSLPLVCLLVKRWPGRALKWPRFLLASSLLL